MAIRRCPVLLGLACVLGAGGALTAPAADDGLDRSQWLWHPEEVAAGEYALFRKRFFLEEAPAGAAVRVTADDAYELYVNGTMAGKGEGWEEMEHLAVGPHLRAGWNVIGFRVENRGDAGGVVAALAFEGAGSPPPIVTDGEWRTATTPRWLWNWETLDFDDSKWKTARVVGRLGEAAPWGDRVRPPAEARDASPDRDGGRIGARPIESFRFEPGDRVVWLGGTFVERSRLYGYLETLVAAANPGERIVFRNLGWSGDDVEGTSRGRFGFQPEGFRHLEHHVRELDPTVIFAAYGGNEAHAGPAGLEPFRRRLQSLLAVLESTGARIVLVTPHRHEALGGKLPDPSAFNEVLADYVAILRDEADRRGHFVLDLFATLPVKAQPGSELPALTYNSIHLTPEGYRRAAEVVADTLGLPVPDWARVENLRRLVVRKNELYFHRWRPQNETYLTLFRKHEQGNNYREIPEFDPLIRGLEEEIEAEAQSLVQP